MEKLKHPPKDAYVNINYLKLYVSKLKLNEFATVQIINDLSRNKYKSYYGAVKYIAICIGVTERTIYNILNTLNEKNIVLRDEKTGYLRVTNAYKKMINEKIKQVLYEDNSMDNENISEEYEETSYNIKDIKEYKSIINNPNDCVSSRDYIKPDYDPITNDYFESASIGAIEKNNEMYLEMIKRLVDKYDESTCNLLINFSKEFGVENFKYFLLTAIDKKERFETEGYLYEKFKTEMNRSNHLRLVKP